MDTKEIIMELLQELCGKKEIRSEDIFLYDLGFSDCHLAEMIDTLNTRFNITILGNPEEILFTSVNDFINCARVDLNG